MASLTRRGLISAVGVSALTASAPSAAPAQASPDPEPGPPTADQVRRLGWWRQARFGLFIHYGLYSVHGRQEWAMEKEAIPIPDYETLAGGFRPKPGAAREWASFARKAGMRYMVFTTKHHEGFCNFDTKLTNYNSVQQGPRRDLVRDYVEAARAEGLRVGLYYSLMDWHHPDGARCAIDEAARRRFVDYIHGQLREILTNYGKVDILWYDGGMPLDAAGWEADRMNRMVFTLQPDIIVNNRNHLPGDFATPEQKIAASANRRAWESCMTLNDSWGYDAADDEWKSPRRIVQNLISCARDGGNYLLNVGPMADGTMPPPSVKILQEVGRWLRTNGRAIFDTDPCQPWRPSYATFTRKGPILYMHVHFWPGRDASLSGLNVQVRRAFFLGSGREIAVRQDANRTLLTGLPAEPPDTPVTTIVLECDGEPRQNSDPELRLTKPRVGVGLAT